MQRATQLQLLDARLRPPRPHVELVQRRALVSRLIKTTEPLVLVSAPAGSGKTVALMQWAAAETRPVGWLRLEADDNDPVVFTAHVAAAIDPIVKVDEDVFEQLPARSAGLEERVLPRLAAVIARARPFVLALDDGQLVTSTQCWRLVERLVEQLPVGAQLVVATRQDPEMGLARLRSEGRLAEYRFPELALSLDETRALVRTYLIEYDEDAVAALRDATEGWATGISLALLGRDEADAVKVAERLREVRGDRRAIAAYLLEEVLERQPPDLQTFLVQTSILRELSAPLCVAVTDRADSGRVLSRLEHGNLFVTTTGDTDEWYRYHHLFADLLQSRLQRDHADSIPDLHRRAAAWHERHGDPVEAVRHWVAAGEIHRTVRLVGQTADLFFDTGRWQSVRPLMELFTEEQLLSEPGLAIEAGWAYAAAVGTPDEQRHWTSLMCKLEFEDGAPADGAVSLRSSYTLLLADLAPFGLRQRLRHAHEAVKLETVVGSPFYEIAREDYGLALYLTGSAKRGERVLRDLLPKLRDEDGRCRVSADLALIAADEGRWEEAAALCAAAEAVYPRFGLEYKRGYCFFVPLLLAHLRLLSHARDPSTMEFLHGIEAYLGHMVHRASWVVLWPTVMMGEVALEQGDIFTASRLAAEALSLLGDYPDAGILGPRARRLADEIERQRMGEPLTPAEKRVLELLPVLLTYDEIAAQLCVSKATVKTQVGAIYRKLQVGKRAEAVERARLLGLLKG